MPNYHDHTFINSSLYDIDIKKLGQFDISHSRGVFTHVADKSLAFNILNQLTNLEVGYGDRNTAGGIQEMLQRYVIYKLGGISDEKMIEISETLFLMILIEAKIQYQGQEKQLSLIDGLFSNKMTQALMTLFQ